MTTAGLRVNQYHWQEWRRKKKERNSRNGKQKCQRSSWNICVKECDVDINSKTKRKKNQKSLVIIRGKGMNHKRQWKSHVSWWNEKKHDDVIRIASLTKEFTATLCFENEDGLMKVHLWEEVQQQIAEKAPGFNKGKLWFGRKCEGGHFLYEDQNSDENKSRSSSWIKRDIHDVCVTDAQNNINTRTTKQKKQKYLVVSHQTSKHQ
jgi:hypothetical protein